MRILHFSDIHLSDENFEIYDFTFRDKLLKILWEEHQKKNIDIVVITGDLVDRGGHSLKNLDEYDGYSDPYAFFEEHFIRPIMDRLKLESRNFLFIAGNHDVDENEILFVDEKFLKKHEAAGEINKLLKDTRDKSHLQYSHRIKKFKDFEEKFHKENFDKNYTFTRNQSTFIYNYKGTNVGFALINDSWRCSTCVFHEYHGQGLFFGTKQLRDSLKILKGATLMNVVLTHHPLEKFAEAEEIKEILTNNDFHLHLYGDQHHHEMHPLLSADGACFGIMARSTLNKPLEPESKWQSGFTIIDLNLDEATTECISYFKYYTRGEFDTDNEVATGGKDTRKHYLHYTPKKVEKNENDDLKLENYFKE
ncbi:metallophosphoesterase [Sphingobacterium multivorum]|uniref:metallophosphoesterase family protein n=1 Tax=Sphingobacterium multivorum TaxID=28454 RepID=UPI002FDB95AF